MEVNDQLIDLLKRENDERLICLVIQSNVEEFVRISNDTRMRVTNRVVDVDTSDCFSVIVYAWIIRTNN
jgi:hypothetical protein